MNIDLPRPVAAYLDAEKAKDAGALARCFGEGAVVRDEGREHRGVAAIEAWHREVNATVPYVVEPLEASMDGAAVVVRARVSGEFPGSPTELRHHFVLEGDRISSLEVRP